MFSNFINERRSASNQTRSPPYVPKGSSTPMQISTGQDRRATQRPLRHGPAQSGISGATPHPSGPGGKALPGALRMAGRRPLTKDEEQKNLFLLPEMSPRDRALVTTQWLTGFRISEVLSLTYGSVWRGEEMLPAIGVAPAHLKGGYGRTRWIPILPELQRALEKLRHWLWLRFELRHDLPLFVSRENDAKGYAGPLAREQARRIIMRAFEQAGIRNDGRLGTHTLRKTWARNVYDASGNSLRSTTRMTGVHRTTILKLLVDLGAVCDDFQDRALRNLPCQRLQCDEIWAFVGCKKANVTDDNRADGYPPDEWILQEGRKPRRSRRPALHALQPLPHPSDAALYASHGRRGGKTRLGP